MINNKFELIGNVCGGLRLLRTPSESQVAKVEMIIIPNDVLDRKGKPNSLRVHAYAAVAEAMFEDVQNGDTVKVEGYIKRTILKPDAKPVVYGTDLVVEDFEVIRKRPERDESAEDEE